MNQNKHKFFYAVVSVLVLVVGSAILLADFPIPNSAQAHFTASFHGCGFNDFTVSPLSLTSGSNITLTAQMEQACVVTTESLGKFSFSAGVTATAVSGGATCSGGIQTDCSATYIITATPGSYTAFVTLPAAGGRPIQQMSQAFTVTAPPPPPPPPPPSPTGTIQVYSRNSVTDSPIAASWYFPTFPSSDPCPAGLSDCSGTSTLYANMPIGNYILQAPYPGQTIPSSYSFGGIFDQGGNAVSSQQVQAGTTSTFGVKWNPEASLQVTPASVSPNGSAPASIQISNNGAPGSGLMWNIASVTYVSNGQDASAALNISRTSGGPIAAGVSNNIIINGISAQAAPACWAPSSCQVQILFNGTSAAPGTQATPNRSVTVTLSMTPPPGSSVSISIFPHVATLFPGGTQQFTAQVTGSVNTNVTWSVTPATGAGTINASGFYTAPSLISSPTTATVRVTSVADPTKSDTAVVTLVPQLGCVLDANPKTIVLPGTSNLIWTCQNTTPQTTCSIDQGIGSVTPAGGTTPVSPVVNTLYTLTCNTLNGSVSANVQVRVNNPGVIEDNP